MVHSPRPIGCQIQLGSPDPLWEWHIPTDALFLSEGARRKLRLEKDVPPTMALCGAHSAGLSALAARVAGRRAERSQRAHAGTGLPL